MAKKVACATLLRWQSLFYPNFSEALICRKKGESTSSTHPFSHKKALYDDDLEKINTLFICGCQQASRMKMWGSRCGREKCHATTCICKKKTSRSRFKRITVCDLHLVWAMQGRTIRDNEKKR